MAWRRRRRNAWKGLAAGVIGGLVASGAMTPVHMISSKFSKDNKKPQRFGRDLESEQEEDATVKVASVVSEQTVGHGVSPEKKKVAGAAVHFAFGALVGGMYGVAAEFLPAVAIAYGIPFGTAVWLGAHVFCVPALKLSKPVTENTLPQEASEVAAHVVYGASAEGIRRLVRKRL